MLCTVLIRITLLPPLCITIGDDMFGSIDVGAMLSMGGGFIQDAIQDRLARKQQWRVRAATAFCLLRLSSSLADAGLASKARELLMLRQLRETHPEVRRVLGCKPEVAKAASEVLNPVECVGLSEGEFTSSLLSTMCNAFVFFIRLECVPIGRCCSRHVLGGGERCESRARREAADLL